MFDADRGMLPMISSHVNDDDLASKTSGKCSGIRCRMQDGLRYVSLAWLKDMLEWGAAGAD